MWRYQLLAEFLFNKGIETIWVSNENTITHAWLIVNDERIGCPHVCFDGVSDDIVALLNSYGGDSEEGIRQRTCYDWEHVKDGLIIGLGVLRWKYGTDIGKMVRWQI